MGKKSFVIFSDWKNEFDLMTDEQAGKIIKAIFALTEDESAKCDDPALTLLFERYKIIITANNKKYEEVSQKRREAAEKRWVNESMQTNAKNANAYNCMQMDYDTDTDTDTDTDKRESNTRARARAKTAPRFSPPSIDDVKKYCHERGNNIDAEKFVNYYTSKGWLVGSAKMRDWKAAVRSWERSDKERGQPKADHNNASYDIDELEEISHFDLPEDL